jgi:diguanylate cyclase (GGDEF)-like protein
VNDGLGHAAGDMLLRQVADRLQVGLRDDDIAARLGGDEFAVLLTETGITAAQTTAKRIGSALRREYDLGSFGPARVDVSIGIACAPDQADEADALLSYADKALYVAKQAGRSNPHVYNARLPGSAVPSHAPGRRPRESMTPRDGLGALRAAGSLVTDLRSALQSEHLHLEYQAICDADTINPVAYEALLRWVDPIRGTVSPSDFISAAEDSGFIVTLSEWVLRRACAEAASWAGSASIGVNLSPLNFSQPDLVATIASILAETGLPANRLIIEITEGVLLDSSVAMQERIHELRTLGIEIWLDDFGTGYANFATLASSPFTSIKIDRSFLSDGIHGRTILGAMITLGQTCGLKVVAEGVETAEQLELLRSLGCDRVQGFLLGLPLQSGAINRSSSASGLSNFD